MYAGIHQGYPWEIENGQLLISSAQAQIGLLKTITVNNRFNNAEQATWFAQGQIDLNGDELQQIEQEKRTAAT